MKAVVAAAPLRASKQEPLSMYACVEVSQYVFVEDTMTRSNTIVSNRAERNQDQCLHQDSDGERIQCKTRRARLATERPYDALILVIR